MANTSHFHPGSKTADMSIDWEVLPSLRGLLGLQRSGQAPQPVWADTMPASLDMLSPSMPFEESMPGLVVREVTEPEVFSVFFGSIEQRANAA